MSDLGDNGKSGILKGLPIAATHGKQNVGAARAAGTMAEWFVFMRGDAGLHREQMLAAGAEGGASASHCI